MYMWQANVERFAELVRRFHTDTARANIFKANRAQSQLLSFNGADAVAYFQRQFGYDLHQAMAFGAALMSAGVFLPIQGGNTFDNSSACEYRFTWTSADESAEKLLVQYTAERRPASYDKEQLVDEEVTALSNESFSEGTLSDPAAGASDCSAPEPEPGIFDEPAEQTEDAVGWLDDEQPVVLVGADVLWAVSSEAALCDDGAGDVGGVRRYTGGSGVEVVEDGEDGEGGEDGEDGGPPLVGEKQASNLAALANLRTKLTAAVQWQPVEKSSQRITLMRNRGLALDRLALQEPVGGSDGEQNVHDPALLVLDSGDGEGNVRGGGNEQVPNDDGTPQPRSGPAGRCVDAGRQGAAVGGSGAPPPPPPPPEMPRRPPARNEHGDSNGERRRRVSMRLRTPSSFSSRCGDMADDKFGADDEDDAPSSRQALKVKVKDIVSLSKFFGPRTGNFREFRTAPGQPSATSRGRPTSTVAERAAMTGGSAVCAAPRSHHQPRESDAATGSPRAAPKSRKSSPAVQQPSQARKSSPALQQSPPARKSSPVLAQQSASGLVASGPAVECCDASKTSKMSGSHSFRTLGSFNDAQASLRKIGSLHRKSLRAGKRSDAGSATSPVSPSPTSPKRKVPIRPNAPME
jgi:hypothetical protein